MTDQPEELTRPEDLEALGYERARDELAEVVRRLETGGLTLDDSLTLWERGEQLARLCQGRLDGARARLVAAMEGDTDVAEDGPADAGSGKDAGTTARRQGEP